MSDAPKRGGLFERKPLRRALWNWLDRHQHPFNRAIHALGIPLAFAGFSAFFWANAWVAVGMVVGGYALQWIGHLVEGNDLGEWAGVKRLLGLPYVGIAPGKLSWEERERRDAPRCE